MDFNQRVIFEGNLDLDDQVKASIEFEGAFLFIKCTTDGMMEQYGSNGRLLSFFIVNQFSNSSVENIEQVMVVIVIWYSFLILVF